jgi:glycosyltransferase involved in cell wall biosynthesis
VHDHRLFCPKGDKLFWFSNQGCNFPCGRACLINTYKKGCLTLLPPFNLLKIRNVNLAMAVHRKLNLIVASSYMKDCLLQNGFSAERIEILPYFCNFSPSLERGMENFVLFAGRIVWQKGLRCLIKSMKNWPEELRLVVAGEGPDLAYSKFLARRLGLSQKIIFLGAVENKQLKDYYERCLLLAMPSLWDEPFGIVGLEAMFCAKPVIAFNVGGISDWLKNEINGFLIERNRMKNFTEKIVYLFSHKDRARQMGLEGEKIYHAGFSKDQHVGRLLEIFKNL